jgi:hypothetical protein
MELTMKWLPFAALALAALLLFTVSWAINQAADKAAPPPIDAKAPSKIETASFALG